MRVFWATRGASLRLNESPSEKEGKWRDVDMTERADGRLNESPSEKEGK